MLDRFSITLRAWGGDKLNCQGPICHCMLSKQNDESGIGKRACEWSENRERAVSGDRCSITLSGNSVAGGEQEDTFADTCRVPISQGGEQEDTSPTCCHFCTHLQPAHLRQVETEEKKLTVDRHIMKIQS